MAAVTTTIDNPYKRQRKAPSSLLQLQLQSVVQEEDEGGGGGAAVSSTTITTSSTLSTSSSSVPPPPVPLESSSDSLGLQPQQGSSAGSSSDLPHWERLPSRNVSFTFAEILTVSELCERFNFSLSSSSSSSSSSYAATTSITTHPKDKTKVDDPTSVVKLKPPNDDMNGNHHHHQSMNHCSIDVRVVPFIKDSSSNHKDEKDTGNPDIHKSAIHSQQQNPSNLQKQRQCSSSFSVRTVGIVLQRLVHEHDGSTSLILHDPLTFCSTNTNTSKSSSYHSNSGILPRRQPVRLDLLQNSNPSGKNPTAIATATATSSIRRTTPMTLNRKSSPSPMFPVPGTASNHSNNPTPTPMRQSPLLLAGTVAVARAVAATPTLGIRGDSGATTIRQRSMVMIRPRPLRSRHNRPVVVPRPISNNSGTKSSDHYKCSSRTDAPIIATSSSSQIPVLDIPTASRTTTTTTTTTVAPVKVVDPIVPFATTLGLLEQHYDMNHQSATGLQPPRPRLQQHSPCTMIWVRIPPGHAALQQILVGDLVMVMGEAVQVQCVVTPTNNTVDHEEEKDDSDDDVPIFVRRVLSRAYASAAGMAKSTATAIAIAKDQESSASLSTHCMSHRSRSSTRSVSVLQARIVHVVNDLNVSLFVKALHARRERLTKKKKQKKKDSDSTENQ